MQAEGLRSVQGGHSELGAMCQSRQAVLRELFRAADNFRVAAVPSLEEAETLDELHNTLDQAEPHGQE